jgi:hypothetical protein
MVFNSQCYAEAARQKPLWSDQVRSGFINRRAEFPCTHAALGRLRCTSNRGGTDPRVDSRLHVSARCDGHQCGGSHRSFTASRAVTARDDGNYGGAWHNRGARDDGHYGYDGCWNLRDTGRWPHGFSRCHRYHGCDWLDSDNWLNWWRRHDGCIHRRRGARWSAARHYWRDWDYRPDRYNGFYRSHGFDTCCAHASSRFPIWSASLQSWNYAARRATARSNPTASATRTAIAVRGRSSDVTVSASTALSSGAAAAISACTNTGSW